MLRELSVEVAVAKATRSRQEGRIDDHSERQVSQELLDQWSRADVAKKIEVFNSASHGFKLKLHDNDPDGKFSGRVKFLLNLSEPVLVHHEQTSMFAKKRHWRVPGGLVKTAVINSKMNCDEVIGLLLQKMNIAKEKSKFALFELDHESRRMRQLQASEQPLVLIMLWANSRHMSISLQERQTVVNAWEQFALIELQNFVRALNTEEEASVKQIEGVYATRRKRLLQLITDTEKRFGSAT